MKVIIKDNAKAILRDTALWYKQNLGQQAKDKFVSGIMSAIRLLSKHPNLGHLAENPNLDPNIGYRILVEHRRHSIVYYIKDNTLYIADIWSTQMKH